MQSSKFGVLFKRFLRGFFAGGLASVAALLATTVTISNLADLKKLGSSLAIAFVTGGLLATEKALRWKEPEQPVEIDSLPDEQIQ
jgi:hypothetical protein